MASRAKSLIAHAAIYLALLGGAMAVASEAGLIVTEKPTGSVPSVSERPTKKIRVHGRIRNLYPGASRSMQIRVRNGYSHRVRLVSVRARDANANEVCKRKYLKLGTYKGRKKIKAKGKVKVRITVALKASAPDECQGARWPLTYRVRVKK